jgi:hypothetical protein
MKLKYLSFIVLFIMSSAFADCELKLNTPIISYGVGDSNPTQPGNVEVTRSKSNSDACNNFFLAFTKGWAGNYSRRATNSVNGDFIYYNIYKSSNSTGVLKEPNDITSPNEVLFGPISKDETKTLTYYFTLAPINASLPPRSGTYLDVIQVQAYSGTYTAINSFESTRDLYVYINVPKFVSLSLVDTGEIYNPSQTSKTLDFGELELNESLQLDVRIVSNAGYVLKVSSANNGFLKRLDGTGSKSEIGYDFYANNSIKGLNTSAAGPVTIASATGRTPSGGAPVALKIVIKSVADKDPGTYQDYITLSVISND